MQVRITQNGIWYHQTEVIVEVPDGTSPEMLYDWADRFDDWDWSAGHFEAEGDFEMTNVEEEDLKAEIELIVKDGTLVGKNEEGESEV
jgi:hypothetical protein